MSAFSRAGHLLSGAAALALMLGLAPESRAAEPVDIELVLAVDVSLSMSPAELEIQRRGYVAALTHDTVLQAIADGAYGKIAVTYVEWAGTTWQHVIVPWTVIANRADAERVVEQLAAHAPNSARRTSISGALQFGSDLFAESGFQGVKRVIDISGDGPNNTGMPVTTTRDAAVAKGIVINGLPILISPSPSFSHLDQYYAECVTGGPGAFVLPVYAASEFVTAIRRKLILEVSGVAGPWADRGPIRVDAASPVDCLQGERDRRFFSDPYFPELNR
ncbi:MAG: DUF1194 domain-containing protein [Mesorhizobium sp.]|nr:MAG: DUF1194 domain-containing protein [Mesorhizobium sp.]